jgi:hypothetical protein
LSRRSLPQIEPEPIGKTAISYAFFPPEVERQKIEDRKLLSDENRIAGGIIARQEERQTRCTPSVKGGIGDGCATREPSVFPKDESNVAKAT